MVKTPAKTPKGRTPLKQNNGTKSAAIFKKKESGKVDKKKGGRQALSSGGRPISKANKIRNKAARMAIATGEIANDEVKRKKERDLRTIYISFKTSELPDSVEEIETLHTDIKNVRVTRQGNKKTGGIHYCFAEFETESKAEAAKNALSLKEFKGGRLLVDYVGEKSKSGGKGARPGGTMPLNPTRLFVSGLVSGSGVTEAKLKQLFPKASRAVIPKRSEKKGTTFGFVQFASPGDAKAAHDACQNLEIDGHHLTVIFARLVKSRENKQKVEEKENARAAKNKAKAKKRKAEAKKGDKVKSKVQKKEEESAEAEENDEDDESNEGEEESETKEDNKEEQSGEDEDGENDEESDEDVQNDEDSDDNEEEGDAEAKGGEESGDEDEDGDDNDDDDDDDDEEVENDKSSDEEDDS